jgi:hypothetical protein
MTKRASSKSRLRSTQNPSPPQHSDVQTCKIAQVEPILATMSFIRPNPEEQEGLVKFEWTAEGRDGQTHDFYQLFRPGENAKLPGPTAGRVIMALLSMSPDRIDETHQITTTLTELTRLCRLRKSRTAHKRIRRALARLQDTVITTNTFWDREGQTYFDKSSVSLFPLEEARPNEG